MRIGIATGLTVVQSSAPDHDEIQSDDTVVGEIPNLAARLQAETDPDTILVSQATRERLGDLFHCEDRGVLTLKGIADGVQAFRVTGHTQIDSRFDALRAQAPTTGFVGRVDEMDRLIATAKTGVRWPWSSLSHYGGRGHGQISPRARAFGQNRNGPRAPANPAMHPLHSGTPFHPIRRYINRLLDGIDADGGSSKPEQLAALLHSYGMQDPEHVAHLDDILSNPIGAHLNERRALDSRYAQIAFLTDLFCAVAHDAGALILEDLQWMDASTVEILSRVADRLDGLQTHILCTMRAGSVPDWCQQAQADVLALGRLAPTDFGDLVRSVARASAPDTPLSDAQISEIATRCDGSPVFAEELTRYTLERTGRGRHLGAIPPTRNPCGFSVVAFGQAGNGAAAGADQRGDWQ